jgi:hypothetical protein
MLNDEKRKLANKKESKQFTNLFGLFFVILKLVSHKLVQTDLGEEGITE